VRVKQLMVNKVKSLQTIKMQVFSFEENTITL